MRNCCIIMVSLLIAGWFPGVSAQEQADKGASPQAYEHASDQAIFNRIGDWFATRGKSEEEKAKIISERKMKRETQRAEKEAQKAKARSEREAQRLQTRTEEQVQEAEQSMGETQGLIRTRQETMLQQREKLSLQKQSTGSKSKKGGK